MGSAFTLTGRFTSSAEKAYVHSFTLANVNPEMARSLFNDHVESERRKLIREHGIVTPADMQKLYTQPKILLSHLVDLKGGNIVTTVSIDPSLIEKLSLTEGEEVEIRVHPQSYRPNTGLTAAAARTDRHPRWVTLNL